MYQRKPLTSERFTEIVRKVRDRGKEPKSVLMHAITYADVRKWGREVLDIGTSTDELRRGLLARAEDLNIGVFKEMPKDMLYFYDIGFNNSDMGELDSGFIYVTRPPLAVYDLITGCWQPGTKAGKDSIV